MWVAEGAPCLLRAQILDYLIGIYAAERVELELLPDWPRAEVLQDFDDSLKEKLGSILREGDMRSPAKFSGRRVSRRVPFDLVRGWIQHCNKVHRRRGNCHVVDQTVKLRQLKVIDCESREIIDMPRNSTPYLALSYVWGTTSQEPPVNSTVPVACPLVIEHAIEVTRKLGYRYLWIDRYCINDQDPADKQHQIAHMDVIYSGADLTLINAAGGGASDGLPGIGSSLRLRQPGLRIGQHTLVSSLPDLADVISCSKWASRGWTFQEGLCSSRRLIFTPFQVYFQCQETLSFESINLPLDIQLRPMNISVVQLPSLVFPCSASGTHCGPGCFAKRVNEYNKRSLTHESDTLNAILGVLRCFEKGDPRHSAPIYHCNGIPLHTEYHNWTTSFVIGLTWRVKSPGSRRPGFPSWSWTGWRSWAGLEFECTISDWHNPTLPDLRIGIRRFDASPITWVSEGNFDLSALSICQQQLYLTSWTTRLPSLLRWHRQAVSMTQLRAARPKCVPNYNSRAVVKQECTAILVDLHQGHESQMYSRMIFILVQRVDGNFERVGLWEMDGQSLSESGGWTAPNFTPHFFNLIGPLEGKIWLQRVKGSPEEGFHALGTRLVLERNELIVA